MPKKITFNDPRKGAWISTVNNICNSDMISENSCENEAKLEIIITENVTILDFTHVHIVLFACLVGSLVKRNYKLKLMIVDSPLCRFIVEDLKILEYYNRTEIISHVDSTNDCIFNLWRIMPERVNEHSISATEYLKRNYFSGLDLSGFKTTIEELYFNVADHSESDGVAYSYMYYDPKNKKIHVAVCDFGLGIPFTLMRANKGKYENDHEALRDSIELFVSAKTNQHNRGMGLDTVISNLSNNDILRIVSNKGLLLCHPKKEPIKLYPLDFDFKGTLIYFDLSTSGFEIEEFISGVNVG